MTKAKVGSAGNAGGGGGRRPGPRAVRRASEEWHQDDEAVAAKLYVAIMGVIEAAAAKPAAALMALEMAEDELLDARARRSLSWSPGLADMYGRGDEPGKRN